MVEIFGKPTFTDADPYEKVNAEWTIQSTVVEKDEDPDDYFYKGFTIYNWKTGYIPTEEYECTLVVMILRQKRLQTQSLRTT